jgi:hypothetical protein
LYLVSNAFEDKQRIPFFRDGVPLLGMQKFVQKDQELVDLFKLDQASWVLSPNSKPDGSIDRSTSTSHGGFDDNVPTVNAALGRMLNQSSVQAKIDFNSSASHLADRRHRLSK